MRAFSVNAVNAITLIAINYQQKLTDTNSVGLGISNDKMGPVSIFSPISLGILMRT